MGDDEPLDDEEPEEDLAGAAEEPLLLLDGVTLAGAGEEDDPLLLDGAALCVLGVLVPLVRDGVVAGLLLLGGGE